MIAAPMLLVRHAAIPPRASAMSEPRPLVELEGLSKGFGEGATRVEVLRDLDLVVILGTNHTAAPFRGASACPGCTYATPPGARCAARGVELKWFGAAEPVGFTSRYDSWRYAPSEAMPETDRILRAILDMRLPLTFSLEDCALIARIIRAEVGAVHQSA